MNLARSVIIPKDSLILYGKYSNTDINITNASIVDNHKNSVITLPDESTDLTLKLYDVIMSNELAITYEGKNMNLHTKHVSDGYSMTNNIVTIEAHFEHVIEQIYSMNIEGKDFDNCYSSNVYNGLCPVSDNVSTISKLSTGHCPLLYSVCNHTDCVCINNHDGPLCGQCSDGYSVAVNSHYLSCVNCNSSLTVIKG